jgi:hypothetical protein
MYLPPHECLALITSMPPCRSQSHAPWHPPSWPTMDWHRLWPILAEALPTLLEQEALPWFCLCAASHSKAAVRAMHLAMISFLHTAKLHRALYGMHRPLLPAIRIGLAPYMIFFGLPGLGAGWGQAPASVFMSDFIQSSSEYPTVQPTALPVDTYSMELWCGCCGTLQGLSLTTATINLSGTCPRRSIHTDSVQLDLTRHGLSVCAFGHHFCVPKPRFHSFSLYLVSPRGVFAAYAPYLDLASQVPPLKRLPQGICPPSLRAERD